MWGGFYVGWCLGGSHERKRFTEEEFDVWECSYKEGWLARHNGVKLEDHMVHAGRLHGFAHDPLSNPNLHPALDPMDGVSAAFRREIVDRLNAEMEESRKGN